MNQLLIIAISVDENYSKCSEEGLYSNEVYTDLLDENNSLNDNNEWRFFSDLYIEKALKDKVKYRSSFILGGLININSYDEKNIINDKITKYLYRNKYTDIYQAGKYYECICSSMKYYPVVYFDGDEENTSFENSWMADRTYGGNRKHEGTDIMTSNNKAGYFPVVSVSNGFIKNIGWLKLGGYRIGITTDDGIYFYYAHLDSFADGIKKGDKVKAGQFLGFMGNSGYGKEGTKGKFDVHLHFGIYVCDGEMEYAVNPYYFLKYIENSKLVYRK